MPVTLEEVYNGNFIEVNLSSPNDDDVFYRCICHKVVRAKPVAKQTSGTRKCNCRMEMRTVQMGPGRVRGRRGYPVERTLTSVDQCFCLVSNDARSSLRRLSKHQVRLMISNRTMKIDDQSTRFVTEEKVLEIEVEAGVNDGYEIPFLAEGSSSLSLLERIK